MKLAVFSDTHNSTDGMLRAVREYSPDALAHLGDLAQDSGALAEAFPELPLYAVHGNCDFASALPEQLCTDLGGHRVFLTHGHRYGVKTSLEPLLNAGHFSGAKLVLFGHTHKAVCLTVGGMLAVNPGSAGFGRERSFALIELVPGSPPQCRIIPIGK